MTLRYATPYPSVCGRRHPDQSKIPSTFRCPLAATNWNITTQSPRYLALYMQEIATPLRRLLQSHPTLTVIADNRSRSFIAYCRNYRSSRHRRILLQTNARMNAKDYAGMSALTSIYFTSHECLAYTKCQYRDEKFERINGVTFSREKRTFGKS